MAETSELVLGDVPNGVAAAAAELEPEVATEGLDEELWEVEGVDDSEYVGQYSGPWLKN